LADLPLANCRVILLGRRHEKNLQHTTSGQVILTIEQQRKPNQATERNCATRDRHGAATCKCKTCPLRQAAEQSHLEEDPERWDGLS
jgi:hypothetical protein